MCVSVVSVCVCVCVCVHVCIQWGGFVGLQTIPVPFLSLESVPMGDQLKWLLKEGGGHISENPLSQK